MRHTTFNFNRTKTKIDTYPDTKEAQYIDYGTVDGIMRQIQRTLS